MGHGSRLFVEAYMTVQVRRALRTVGLFVAIAAFSGVNAQQSPTVVKAVQLTGLPGVKENAKGKLSVENGNLHFTSGETISDVSASSILDVVTGSDSQKAVGKTIGMLSMAAPYGGGRVVSLFRKKIDTLTLEYRDAEGAFHGAIFTMPLGTADGVKKELIAQGAHTTIAPEQAGSAQVSPTTSPKEQKQ
jgi:hypothetical protein